MAKRNIKAIVLDRVIIGLIGRYDVQVTQIDDDIVQKEASFEVTLRETEHHWGGISCENALQISPAKGRNRIIIEAEENDRGGYDIIDIIPDDEKSKKRDTHMRNTLYL